MSPNHPLISLCTLLHLLFFLTTPTATELTNETSPTHRFRSRPDLHPPILQILSINHTLLLPGYIFLAPYRNLDPAPYIYTSTGDLIWSGAGSGGPKSAHAPKPCTFRSAPHLCFFQGAQHKGYSRGHGVILNQRYEVVKTVESTGSGAVSDMHEFELHTGYIRGGGVRTTAIVTVFQTRVWDFVANPRLNVEGGAGFIQDGVFQEVDVESGELVFEWRSLDHVDPGVAWVMPGSSDTSGDGLSPETSWDYFHINSIDKNGEGDYLVSGRHVGAIYKISGVDGSIMWQMGGNSPTIDTVGFNFSYQHHARWLSENGTHTILSFFDNASNTYNSTSDVSTGLIVSINHITNTARTLNRWMPPNDTRYSSGSQGSLQLLRDGYTHIGWGEYPCISEHTWTGEVALYGKIAERESNVMIYRSGKYNWTGMPKTKPALVTYSLNGETSMGFWISWNGATEVSEWRFYVGDTAKGPWRMIGTRLKDGFESEFWALNASMWSYAEALDRDGRVLEKSEVARTFVPGEKLRQFCDKRGCPDAKKTPKEKEVPYEVQFYPKETELSMNRGFDTTHYYQDMERRGSPPELLTSLLMFGLFMGACLGVWFILAQKGALLPLARKTSMLKQQMVQAIQSSRAQYSRLQGDEVEEVGITTGRWRERSNWTSRVYS